MESNRKEKFVITTIALLISLISLGHKFIFGDKHTVTRTFETVCICTSKKSIVYHKDANCKSLEKCDGDVEVLLINQARERGRKPCAICCTKGK